ncbi:hypothetical protein [Marinobacterium litorale]|uniref:hypothetical protein n=1 Tax=Marinobacterium litorale TaxID=404770 RepID=UPI000488E02F|nr:hypothetical protein [Marinobacterium litorale]
MNSSSNTPQNPYAKAEQLLEAIDRRKGRLTKNSSITQQQIGQVTSNFTPIPDIPEYVPEKRIQDERADVDQRLKTMVDRNANAWATDTDRDSLAGNLKQAGAVVTTTGRDIVSGIGESVQEFRGKVDFSVADEQSRDIFMQKKHHQKALNDLVAAGSKLGEQINNGEISPEEAAVRQVNLQETMLKLQGMGISEEQQAILDQRPVLYQDGRGGRYSHLTNEQHLEDAFSKLESAEEIDAFFKEYVPQHINNPKKADELTNTIGSAVEAEADNRQKAYQEFDAGNYLDGITRLGGSVGRSAIDVGKGVIDNPLGAIDVATDQALDLAAYALGGRKFGTAFNMASAGGDAFEAQREAFNRFVKENNRAPTDEELNNMALGTLAHFALDAGSTDAASRLLLRSKVTQSLGKAVTDAREKLSPIVNSAGKVLKETGAVAATTGIETVTGGLQSLSQETLMQGHTDLSKVDDNTVLKEAFLEGIGGGVTGSAFKAPAIAKATLQTGIEVAKTPGKAKAANVTKVRERVMNSGDTDSLLRTSDKTITPEEKVDILRARNEVDGVTPEEVERNNADIQEIQKRFDADATKKQIRKEAVESGDLTRVLDNTREDFDPIEALSTIQSRNMQESATEGERAQNSQEATKVFSSLIGEQESILGELDAIRESGNAAQKTQEKQEIESRKQALDKMVTEAATLLQEIRSYTHGNVEANESAATQLEEGTAAEDELKPLAQRIVTAAMYAPQSIGSDTVQKALKSSVLTTEQREYLESFAASQNAISEAESTERVSKDIFEGSEDGNWRGIKQYRTALSTLIETGNQPRISRLMSELNNFTESKVQRAQDFRRAYDAAVELKEQRGSLTQERAAELRNTVSEVNSTYQRQDGTGYSITANTPSSMIVAAEAEASALQAFQAESQSRLKLTGEMVTEAPVTQNTEQTEPVTPTQATAPQEPVNAKAWATQNQGQEVQVKYPNGKANMFKATVTGNTRKVMRNGKEEIRAEAVTSRGKTITLNPNIDLVGSTEQTNVQPSSVQTTQTQVTNQPSVDTDTEESNTQDSTAGYYAEYDSMAETSQTATVGSNSFNAVQNDPVTWATENSGQEITVQIGEGTDPVTVTLTGKTRSTPNTEGGYVTEVEAITESGEAITFEPKAIMDGLQEMTPTGVTTTQQNGQPVDEIPSPNAPDIVAAEKAQVVNSEPVKQLIEAVKAGNNKIGPQLKAELVDTVAG